MDETVTIEETVTLDESMNVYESMNVDEETVTVESEFYEDLKVFCFELYEFVVARRYWYSEYPEPIVVTEGSEFTEEVGKAVLVTWHHHRKMIKNMIEEDYPKFIGTPDNLERYVIARTDDLMKKSAFETFSPITEEYSFLKEFLLVTAFSIDVYIFCYDNLQDSFLPFYVDFWCKLFMKQFNGRFQDYGWNRLREECLPLSRKYDLEQVEKQSAVEKDIIYLKGKYFTNDEQKAALIGDEWRSKSATRFYTMEEKHEKIIDSRIRLAEMDAIQTEIDGWILNPREERCEIHCAPKVHLKVNMRPMDKFLKETDSD